MQTIQSDKIYAPPVRSKTKIGNTTFIVNSYYPEKAKESVVSKIERLIKADVQKEVTNKTSESG